MASAFFLKPKRPLSPEDIENQLTRQSQEIVALRSQVSEHSKGMQAQAKEIQELRAVVMQLSVVVKKSQ